MSFAIMRRLAFAMPAGIALMLAGCGTYVPDILPQDQPNATAFLVNQIVNHVKCELRDAVLSAIEYDKQNAATQPDRQRRIKWLESWGAKFTLKFIIDEKGTLNPAANFTQPFSNMQSFVLGLTGGFSSDATRTDQVDFFFVFKDDFIDKAHEFPNRPRHCIESGGMLVNGDLKIQEWVWASLFPFFLPENVHATPPDVLSHEVQFVVVAGVGVTPTWNLVQVAVNPAGSGPFATVSHTRTDDLLITMGPAATTVPGGGVIPVAKKGPSRAVEDSHLASQIGSAVSSAVRRP